MLEACKTRITPYDVLRAYVVDRLNEACPQDFSDLSKRNPVAQSKSCNPSFISFSTHVLGAFRPTAHARSTRRISPVNIDGGELTDRPRFLQ